MVMICGPFLGKTDHCGGKEDADDDADGVSEECYDEASPLRMVSYKVCDAVIRLYATQSPNCGDEYPRPQQHNEDASKQAYIVGSGAISC